MVLFDLPENLTKITELLTVADSYTGGLTGLIILIMIGFGTLFLTSAFNSRDSLIVSTFVSMISALFLKYLNILGDGPLLITAILFLAAIIFGSVKGNQGA